MINLIHLKIISSLSLVFVITYSCFSPKKNLKIRPNLDIKIIHKWEKLIAETSIKSSSVDGHTKELYIQTPKAEKNSFVLHYKIASVECITVLPSDSIMMNKKIKEYKLSYDMKGNLVKEEGNLYSRSYYYDEKGQIDSTELFLSVLGAPVGNISFMVEKEITTWGEAKGKTGFFRLIEKELFGLFYYKNKRKEYEFLAKIQFFYENDGLLSQIKTFDHEGVLISKNKFKYIFYK